VTGRYSLIGWDPWVVVSSVGSSTTVTTSHATRVVIDNPLRVLRGFLARYPGPRGVALPPVGTGVFGIFGYELNRWIERLPMPEPRVPQVPEMLIVGMRMLVVVDHATNRSWWISVVDPHQPPRLAHAEARARLDGVGALCAEAANDSRGPRADEDRPCASLAIEPTMTRAQFERMVRRAQRSIACGDIFQANLSQRFVARGVGSAWALAQRLRDVNPSPFASFIQTPDWSIASCSPERLVRVEGRRVSTRPIAGTWPRGRTPNEDAVNSLELLLSDKERAEHLMLVDLERNDLGRICRVGSVRVNELMTLEDYSHVIHIVSNIEGRLRPEVDAVDVLRAMFPGGTITGCPKVRCMELVHQLEPVGRGFYTGSLGWLGFDGDLDLNIVIRTIVVSRDRAWFHVGAGIVADSQPEREYHETLAKAGALMAALQPSTTAIGMPHARVA